MSVHYDSDHVLSLFSGAGGFSLGFSAAGLKPLCGAELDKDACATYEINVGSTCHNVDLSCTPPSFFKFLLGGKSPFVIIGGPPCQGFSTAGSRNAEDARNKLIFNYLNIVNALRPRWFIFENVEGFLTSGNGKSVYSLVKEFLRIGYSIRLEKINLAGFGIPQTRKRVLIVGNRMGIDFSFPEEKFSYDSGKAKKNSSRKFAPTVFEAIAGLGNATENRTKKARYISNFAASDYEKMMRRSNSSQFVSEHFDNTSENDAIKYGFLSEGQSMKDLPEFLWHDSFRKRAFRRVKDGTPSEKRGGAPTGIKRLRGNLQSLTITGAACREFIHPVLNRPLTIRECARIQSFPDCFEFHGNAASVMQQIGNAVPPLVSEVLAEHLVKIDGFYGSGMQTSAPCRPARILGYVLTEAMGMSNALKRTDSLLREIQQLQLGLT